MERHTLLALRPQHISWLFRYNIKTIRTLSYIFPLFDSVLPAISRSHNGSCYHFIHKFEKLNSVTVFWANESFTGSVSNSISSMRRSVSSLILKLINNSLRKYKGNQCLMSVWKSDETLLSICILNFSFKNDFV